MKNTFHPIPSKGVYFCRARMNFRKWFRKPVRGRIFRDLFFSWWEKPINLQKRARHFAPINYLPSPSYLQIYGLILCVKSSTKKIAKQWSTSAKKKPRFQDQYQISSTILWPRKMHFWNSRLSYTEKQRILQCSHVAIMISKFFAKLHLTGDKKESDKRRAIKIGN